MFWVFYESLILPKTRTTFSNIPLDTKKFERIVGRTPASLPRILSKYYKRAARATVFRVTQIHTARDRISATHNHALLESSWRAL